MPPAPSAPVAPMQPPSFGAPMPEAPSPMAPPASLSDQAQPGPAEPEPNAAAQPNRAELRAFLYSFHNDPKGVFWPVYADQTVVGRAGSGEVLDLEIHDPTTSSRHAVLVSNQPGQLTLHDAGSTNGTFVNDQPVGYGGNVELHDGDRIRFGAYCVTVRFASP